MVIEAVSRTRIVTAADLRSLTGFNASRDISDPDLEDAIDRAQAAVVSRLSQRIVDAPLIGDLDGDNTRFMLPRDRLARIILDHNLDEAMTAADVKVVLREDSTTVPTYTEATVASVDGLRGIVTLDAAPPNTTAAVLLTARVVSAPIDKEALQLAVTFFAAHLATKAATRSGKVNLANPQAENKDKSQPDGADQSWLRLYMKEMSRLASRRGKAASKSVTLPRTGHILGV